MSNSSIVKRSLRKLSLSNEFEEKIQQAVYEVNSIVTEGYHLIYLHVLRLLEEKIPIPKFDQAYVKKFLFAVSIVTDKRGRPPKKGEDEISIDKTYEQLYKPLRNGKKPLVRSEIHYILDESATDMATAINNNIQVHFLKRQQKHIKLVKKIINQTELYKVLKTLIIY
jgi:hypothetical protein